MASYSSEDVYNIDYSKPGLVLIINNQNFVRTEERKGSEKDARFDIGHIRKFEF